MIIKILSSASSEFNGIKYNDKKVEKGQGELMLMKNFPSFINESSSQQTVRDYLKSVSKNDKVKKTQFHAVISTKFQEHSKDELTKFADGFMDELGYGKQPFVVVHHNDTENSHVHIVTTRVDKETGKKINDSYEKLKAQQALSDTLEKLYGIESKEKLNRLLNYKISSIHQLETLLDRNGYKLGKNTNDEKFLTLLKNGVIQRILFENRLIFDNKNDKNRTKQLRAILWKYKNIYSNKVFKVEDFRKQEGMLPEEKIREKDKLVPKIEFESELQKKLRDVFGIDIVFHHKDEYQPFGYTLIDHKTGTVYKGSEIMKMSELFEFTSEKIDKKLFESLKDYNVRDSESKILLLNFLKVRQPENEIKEFMLFGNKKLKNNEIYNAVRNDVRGYLKKQSNRDISIIKSEDAKYYAIHSRLHYIGEVQSLIGEKQYQKLLDPNIQVTSETEIKTETELNKAVNELFFELMKSSCSAKDPAEQERKKRRKRR